MAVVFVRQARPMRQIVLEPMPRLQAQQREKGAGGKDFIIYCNKYIRVTNGFAGLPHRPAHAGLQLLQAHKKKQ